MEQHIRDNGKMVCMMERELRYGQMDQNMRVNGKWVNHMDGVNI